MAFENHLRLTALGRIGTPEADRFSYGFCMAPDSGAVDVGDFEGTTANQWTDLMDSVRDFHGRANTRIESTAVLEMVKVALIGPDGKYLSDPIHRDYNQAGNATPTGHVLPQSALAISLTTDRRGPSGKGRFYIPVPALSVDNTDGFRVALATIEAVRDSAATMLNDVNNALGVDVIQTSWNVVVASTKGYNTRVTGVRVGRILDTIRSRRNKLQESYTDIAGVS